jgi:hypothetical protein
MVNKFLIFYSYFLINSVDQPLDLWPLNLSDAYKSTNLIVNRKRIHMGQI